LRASFLAPFAQQPGTPEPPGTPPRPPTRPDGSTALRGPAASDPDTPARSAARCDRRPAAAPQRVGITGPASSRSPPHRLSNGRSCGKANDGPPGFRSPAASRMCEHRRRSKRRVGAILSNWLDTRIAGRNPIDALALVANHQPMREADHVYKDRPGRFGEPGDARGRRTLACHNCLYLCDRFWNPRLSGAGAPS
jgi:hypothetical protein